jgi:radical SAM superfamily enzyme YgiQ (UPF0313 family)
MNVLIISTNQTATPAPVLPAGPCLVAEAARNAGHQVSLLDLLFEPDPVRTVQDLLRKTAYDVIGLSVRNIDNNDMVGTAFYLPLLEPVISAIRDYSDALLVMGGAALTVMPEQVMRYLQPDCAVIGDGETAFCRLLDRLERKEPWDDVPGIACTNNGQFRSNPQAGGKVACSLPDYSRWVDLRAYRARMSTVPLQSKQGCRFQCVYCTYRKIEGNTYRLFDPAQVVDNARKALMSGIHDLEFVDNVFNAPCEHALQVCEAFIRSGCRARLHSLELNPAQFTDELLTLMERAGFVGIGLTVESAADEVLHGLCKGFTSRDVHAAADIVSRHHLPCAWIFMLGGPGETEDTVRETLRFARERILPRDVAFFNVGIRIYPGTGLEAIARQQGLLLASGPDGMLQPAFYVSPAVSAAWMRQQVNACMDRNLNFMSADTFTFPYLPLLYRMGHLLGIKPPLWRHTAAIRKGLRFVGMNV